MPCAFCNTYQTYSSVQLCYGCFDSGKKVVEFLEDSRHDHLQPSLIPASANTYKKVSKWIEIFGEQNKQLEMKVDFLKRLCAQFRKETPPDIQLKAGDDHPCLPAHVTMLAARSEVLKNVVGVDEGLKSAASSETVLTFLELKGEELESLLEFLYTGSLSKEMMDKHAYSLLIAADKYDIPYLLQVCETHIVQSVVPDSMLDKLANKCFKFLRDNQSAPAVLSSSSPALFLEMLIKAFVSGATA